MGNFIDLTDKKIGKLTVIKMNGKDKNGHCKWLCQCDCGNTKNVLGTHLIRGNIRSCGCLSKKNKFLYENKYGNSTNYKRLYSIFNGMRSRCYNIKDVNYNNYGARGIKIYDKWINNFFEFMDWAMQNGYKKNLTIDRIDNNGNYEPNNCRWTTLKEQENNRRDNVFLKYKGKVKTLKQWAETIGISYNTLYSRYSREIELVNNSVKSQIDISKILYKKDLRKKEKK